MHTRKKYEELKTHTKFASSRNKIIAFSILHISLLDKKTGGEKVVSMKEHQGCADNIDQNKKQTLHKAFFGRN